MDAKNRGWLRQLVAFSLFVVAACAVGEEEAPGCRTDADCERGVCRAGGCFDDPGSPLPPADPGAGGDGGSGGTGGMGGNAPDASSDGDAGEDAPGS